MEAVSEEITLVEREEDILGQISPCFRISETKYGGKGCFSYQDIPKGATVLVCKNPFSFTISQDFRKEVCHYCFLYENGRSMKCKLTLPGYQSLYFCSDECCRSFESIDNSHVLLRLLLNLDKLYAKLSTDELEHEDEEEGEDFVRLIKEKWQQAERWNERMSSVKPSKWESMIPKINEAEYLEIRYIYGALFQMHQEPKQAEGFLEDMSVKESLHLEKELFGHLQSNEILKVCKFKYLLNSYIKIFKFVKLTCPKELQPLVTPDNIRLIIGRNLTNAFGIWTLDKGDKEFLGFGVYPSGSFFNHSCAPNIIKKRVKNQLHFVTIKDVAKNEELCIDYGNYLDEPVAVRKLQLSEWFFDCGCTRCREESA